MKKPTRRGVVGVLGGGAAALAFTVGAVSLTRFAGDFLGFPAYLEWTFTGAVDVAGIAGGVMWTGFRDRIRNIGRAMNIACTAVSGICVGLDHATHAGRALRETGGADWLTGTPIVWAVAAFIVGAIIPALFAWILHGLAVMADQTVTRPHGGRDKTDHDTATPVETHHEAVLRPHDRETAPVAAAVESSLVATTGTPHREAITVGTATTPLPRMHLVNARPAWASDELIDEVIQAVRATEGGRRNYGVPTVQERHRLPDGGRIGSHRAGALLAHVDELMEVAA